MMDTSEINSKVPVLTPDTFQYINSTGPWMFFIGILGFVSSGLMLLFGILIICAADELRLMGGVNLLGIIYIAAAAICFIPSRFLVLAGSNIQRMKKNGANQEVFESALHNTASYWKFSGIFSIICIAVMVIVLIVVLITAVILS
jgi:hypothetical protein